MRVPEEVPVSPSNSRTERLNMRLTPDALALIRDAAATQNQDVSAFVLGAALDRAREVKLNEHFLELSIDDIRELDKALAREPQVIEQLANQLRRARENISVTHVNRRRKPTAVASDK